MKRSTLWMAGLLAAPFLMTGPVRAQEQDLDDVILDVLDEGEGEETVVRELTLPEAASDQGRQSSAFGLATANAARQRGGEENGEEPVEGQEEGEEPEEGEDSVERTPLSLPETASDQARESSAFGLATANEARERSREFGQDRAADAREAAAERADEARTAGQERAAEAREKGEAAREAGQARAQENREAAAERRGPPEGVPAGPPN